MDFGRRTFCSPCHARAFADMAEYKESERGVGTFFRPRSFPRAPPRWSSPALPGTAREQRSHLHRAMPTSRRRSKSWVTPAPPGRVPAAMGPYRPGCLGRRHPLRSAQRRAASLGRQPRSRRPRPSRARRIQAMDIHRPDPSAAGLPHTGRRSSRTSTSSTPSKGQGPQPYGKLNSDLQDFLLRTWHRAPSRGQCCLRFSASCLVAISSGAHLHIATLAIGKNKAAWSPSRPGP
jgi:hypothetical protein